MPKLLFIKNLKELNYLNRNLKHLLTTHKLITICSLPWLYLYEQGFSVEQASDYLPVDDFKKIIKESRIILKEWYKPFGDLLNYRGINLGELVRPDLSWFFRELMASYLALQRIIDIHKPDEIAIFADLDFPNLSASRYNGTSDIFAATSIWMCETNKIPIYKLHLKRQFKKRLDIFWRRTKRKIGRHLPHTLFFYRYLKRLSKNIIYRYEPNRIPLSLSRRSDRIVGGRDSAPQETSEAFRAGGQKLAVALGSSFELLILKNIMETLSDLGGFNVAFVNLEPDFNVTKLKNRSGLDVETGLKFVSLDDFNLSVMPERMNIIFSLQRARKCLDSANIFKNEFLPSYFSRLLSNPNLTVQFDFLWADYFYEAVQMIDKVYCLYRSLHPDVVIVANAVSYAQRAFIKLAQKFKAKSIVAPHGWVGEIDDYEFESDLFLAWGEFSQKQLREEFNKSVHNIAVVGAAQFDRFINPQRQSSALAVKEIKERLGLRLQAQAVLILTGGMAQSVSSAVDMKRFFEFWEFIKSFIREHPDIDFIIRPHPTEEIVDWYRQMVKFLNKTNLKIIEEEKLDVFLPAIDVGISAGVPSTADYLCILFGIPIIIFKSFNRTDILSTIEAWNEDNGLLVTKQESDLATLTMQLLSDNNFREDTIEREQNFLDKSLLVRDGKAKERIARAVKDLCN